jgi:type I restriction enzyme S subunit
MSSAKAANIELANGKWKHFQVCEGDILYTISGTIGRTAIVYRDDLPLLMNTSVVRFRPLTDELDRNYLYYYVRSKFFLDQLTNFVSGTAIKNVGPTHIKKLEISFPPIKEQKKISQKLDLLKIETNLLDDSYRLEFDAIEELKQSILQEAFNGNLTMEITA